MFNTEQNNALLKLNSIKDILTMNVKETVATAILLLPVVASVAIAKPATAESQVRLVDSNITITSRGGHHDGHFHRHYRKIWVPGYWKVNKFGHRYWVPGYYKYVFFK
jgi:hypothetical protein